MSELIERLREVGTDCDWNGVDGGIVKDPLLHEAADTIERLTAERDEARQDYSRLTGKHNALHINARQARDERDAAIKRAEAAERDVASLRKDVHDLNWALGTEGYDRMHDDADEAEHQAAVADINALLERMEARKRAMERMHTFLNAAAGEGLVLDGIDAAELYIALFLERYAAATQGAEDENNG